MKYAVVNIAGRQHKVREGEELIVGRLAATGKTVFDQVYLLVDEGKVTVGTPTVSGAKVEVEVSGEEKGEKIRVVKYKAKSRYRKTRGFRALLSRIKVTKIVS